MVLEARVLKEKMVSNTMIKGKKTSVICNFQQIQNDFPWFSEDKEGSFNLEIQI